MGGLLYSSVGTYTQAGDILERLEIMAEGEQLNPMVTRWKSQVAGEGPLEHEVTTHPVTGDTPESQAARHAQRVAALKAQFPPVE